MSATVGVNKSPKLVFPAGQRQTFAVRPRLIAGRVLTDFSSFALTVREDPDYPRAADELDAADPLGDAWATVSVSASIAIDSDDGEQLNVSFTVPSDAGERRYAFDVKGTLTVGSGVITLYPATWLSVDVTC